MTPAARVAAAIEVLDAVIAGSPAEQALTRWARNSRYAGSKDRAALRDLVFDVLRQRRSALWCSGQVEESGRALMTGLLCQQPEGLTAFDGSRYGPVPLTSTETGALRDLATAPEIIHADLPDLLVSAFRDALGDDWLRTAKELRSRAAVHLRVNTLRASRDEAMSMLADEGIVTRQLGNVSTGLEVVENPRRIARSQAYSKGLVELQDASGQIATLAAGVSPGDAILDYCAGGGGKILALAAAAGGTGRFVAHDVDNARMRDLPARADRAGISVECVSGDAISGSFDCVFVDAPCSGSGTWRRAPEGKWLLTPDRLAAYPNLQLDILSKAARHLRPNGRLTYATCSLLPSENTEVVKTFLDRYPNFTCLNEELLSVTAQCDGFCFAHFVKN
ncbi:RsmB/NOP family class I SAM-dependent RNA methyltransferase [Algicella marina]|uniref:RsmB/NOP family class I SAM-dependent RNA methyltransferase n=1 Tax=Algicella marina TaxID=2683284 RepID=A0A6P1SZC2_9RHOB|nr:RsmB/NOP family class I SAM-dependent RNA methyltransferase [Algicella marina]QHQ34875.1 RsmB/NOP family class I SAM-dependent RNA methyltransferase [Algicella marina]